jgi:hypothetical protein
MGSERMVAYLARKQGKGGMMGERRTSEQMGWRMRERESNLFEPGFSLRALGSRGLVSVHRMMVRHIDV